MHLAIQGLKKWNKFFWKDYDLASLFLFLLSKSVRSKHVSIGKVSEGEYPPAAPTF